MTSTRQRCEHDLELCFGRKSRNAIDARCSVCGGNPGASDKFGVLKHHTDGTACVPILGKDKQNSYTITDEHADSKCPTCGSVDGVPLWRSVAPTVPHLHVWHNRDERPPHRDASCDLGNCQPCPTCSVKKLHREGKLNPAWYICGGCGQPEYGDRAPWHECKKEEPKCPTHGKEVCADGNPHWHEKSYYSIDGCMDSPHFLCGCPKEQGSGDAVGSESPTVTANKGAAISRSPDSSIFADVAREIHDAVWHSGGHLSVKMLAETILSHRFGPLVQGMRDIVEYSSIMPEGMRSRDYPTGHNDGYNAAIKQVTEQVIVPILTDLEKK